MGDIPVESDTLDSSRALLDTTIQLDRIKTCSRQQYLQPILERYEFRFSSSFSIVELKATIIQECVTIHNQLRRSGARFTSVRDALLEKDHPQSKLRAHIFNNYITVMAGSSFDITPDRDLRLADEARLLLENVIGQLFLWFNSTENVDVVLKDKLRCNRASEAPQKRTAAYESNLPKCVRGKNKTCCVENLIRSKGSEFVNRLRPLSGNSVQLEKSVKVLESVLSNPEKELSVSDCRNVGDCLIALEGEGFATHALSTNARDWGQIASLVNLEFVLIDYPEEKTW